MLARINKRYVPTYWDDFFNDSFFNNYQSAQCNHSTPAVNIVEDDASFTIEVAAPGMTRKDFHIEVDNDILTVSREHKEDKEVKERKYMRREFSYSNFKRSFQLPDTIDMDSIKASHDSGILTIQLPKKEEVVQKAPKQIEIK